MVQALAHAPNTQGSRGEFGCLLRQWRRFRGLSQIDVATDARISIRHLSFLENGISLPSVNMVLRLCEVMSVPAGERNRLLMTARFAPLFRETGLDAPEMKELHRTLQLLLRNHEPYPASVTDRYHNIVMNNEACRRGYAQFFDPDRLWGNGPRNVNDTWLSPLGFRPYLLNWAEVARWLITQVYLQAHASPEDPVAQQYLERWLAQPGVREVWRQPEPGSHLPPMFDVHLRKGGVRRDVRILITTLGSPQDVFLKELRIAFAIPLLDPAAKPSPRHIKTRRG